ncbi:hypothetical protein IOD13_13765 [Brevibacterium casei]|nr:hypothetical protein [Brevibacterium casei]
MTALVCLGWADQTDIARETHLDQSSSGRLRAETANAALPLPIVKMRAWETVVTGSLSNDVLSAIISGFVAPSARRSRRCTSMSTSSGLPGSGRTTRSRSPAVWCSASIRGGRSTRSASSRRPMRGSPTILMPLRRAAPAHRAS